MWVLIWSFLIASAVAENEIVVDEFTQANNKFAATTYKEIVKKEDGNFLVSPFSAETVLAFAHSGCKEETAKEIRNALHLPDNKEQVEKEIKNLLPQLKSNEFYSLHTANKMYVKENFPIKEEFKKTAEEVFHTEAENVDFAKNVEAAEKINTWVEQNTNNKIHNLVDPDILDNKTRVVLLNALYFKSDWKIPFPLSATRQETFYKNGKEAVQVETLHYYAMYRSLFNYYECPHLHAKFLELSFGGEDASMTIILPNERDGLSDLEAQIDRALVPHDLKRRRVNIALPKFKIESTIDFKDILKNLGVKNAFHKDLADLSGIAGEKGDLIIDKVAQKTFIDVSEQGVEAAAATHVAIKVPMSAMSQPEEFIADHPFMFYIKIKNVIVFIGRVTDPSS